MHTQKRSLELWGILRKAIGLSSLTVFLFLGWSLSRQICPSGISFFKEWKTWCKKSICIPMGSHSHRGRELGVWGAAAFQRSTLTNVSFPATISRHFFSRSSSILDKNSLLRARNFMQNSSYYPHFLPQAIIRRGNFWPRGAKHWGVLVIEKLLSHLFHFCPIFFIIIFQRI